MRLDPCKLRVREPEMIPIHHCFLLEAVNHTRAGEANHFMGPDPRVPDSLSGMKYVLKLVVRRIIVGNLGTGTVERRFGEAARKISETEIVEIDIDDLRDLHPDKIDFVSQLKRRSFNKSVLAFMRRSILQNTITPSHSGNLHFIWTKQAPLRLTMGDEEGAYWSSTIGNTFLAKVERRPNGIDDWSDFKQKMLTHAINNEWVDRLSQENIWHAAALRRLVQRWLWRRVKSGMTDHTSEDVTHAIRLLAALNRQGELKSLDALSRALKPKRRQFSLTSTAIALDSSVFLRLASHADIVDYLNAQHSGPIILPGQSIQTFGIITSMRRTR